MTLTARGESLVSALIVAAGIGVALLSIAGAVKVLELMHWVGGLGG